MKSPRRAEQGVVLITVMIFLLLITVFSLSMFRASTTNVQVTGNMQMRQEALHAATIAVEETLSNNLFAKQTARVASSPVDVDLNGDGNADYRAQLQLRCIRTLPVGGNGCSSSQGTAQDGSMYENTGCVETDWNVRAEVTDITTGTTVAVNQGIAHPDVTPPAECPPRQ
ncbi:pilus assembly PilX family protein [Caldimonas brevitalea]|uniref:Type 4 fimbrial biogenesis protein PilX N-terminal domain-containing protein n=1 Tax=Caldimonas brevitalea TaxID=413882 RepID=A0A0G3BSE9_9BURK|nr:hypothetical protein [Caldimonas brevitalea]AKJ29475.1 hypothetical protein AAW51_2784 [Caldimonas brevitalea]